MKTTRLLASTIMLVANIAMTPVAFAADGHILTNTTSSAESADQAIPGHAHRGYNASSPSDASAPIPKAAPAATRSDPMDGTDHTMKSDLESEDKQLH